MTSIRAIVDDTYAEGFRSIYAEILVTARDLRWLQHAVNAVTGHASSTIMCDCESGVDQVIESQANPDANQATTPDGQPGAILQFHVPRFRKDREEALERTLLARISQNILTCPTTACFNLVDSDPYFKLGRKIAFFGDGFQYRDRRHGRAVWVIPIMGGDFIVDRRFGFQDGIMGGNLWFMGRTIDAAILAAERAVQAVSLTPGTIAPFPGGVAASASKAGSRYKFLVASTYQQYCPTLKNKLGPESKVPDDVQSIMEIVINGRDLAAVTLATHAAIEAAVTTPDLVRITAGNYGGRLGKSFIYLKQSV